MGNRLRHAYDGADLEVVWLTATTWLPNLEAEARRTLLALEGDPREPDA